ncbi:MAG TPA: hypothetical protein VD997_15635 [Phycisphaerales bacterium]|nr:hypothetical protein [Phycisphaerales bacterium]
MIEPTSERGKRLSALSARLRVLHSELADQDKELRSEQLQDEVKRAISGLAPNEREPFLLALMEQFPSFTDGARSAPPPPPVVAAAPAAEVKDPKVLCDKLIEHSRFLSDADRAAITQKLAGAGFAVVQVKEAPAGAGGLPAAQLAEFKKTLQMSPEQEVSAARVVETASVLAEFVLKLEPWACTYWRDLAPDAKNSVFQVLNKELPKFVAGDEKVTKEVIHKSAYRLRSLVSLLMKGVIEAGRQFARDHMAKYSLDAIRQAAPREMFKADEYRYWKQYERLMDGVDGSSIELRMKQVIAKDVDAGLSQVIR